MSNPAWAWRSSHKSRGVQWENAGSVNPCLGSRTRRLIRDEGRYVGDIALPGTAFGYVLRSPHAHARIRSIDTDQRQGRARRAGGAHRRGLAGLGLRRPAGPGRAQAPRRLADVPAALSGAGQGPRALGRRLRRLRGGRDHAPGAGRGRADRGRLRAAAGRSSRPRDATAPGAPLVCDDCPNNICFVQLVRRQGRDRRGLRQAPPTSSSSAS